MNGCCSLTLAVGRQSDARLLPWRKQPLRGIAANLNACWCRVCCLLPAAPVPLQVLWEALWAGEPGLHLYMCLAVLEHHRRRILR
jgi:hypothetical protein